MNTTYMTLAEINKQLACCTVTAVHLEELGFKPVDTTQLDKERFSPEQWRKFRAAKLYEREKMPEIRAKLSKIIANKA